MTKQQIQKAISAQARKAALSKTPEAREQAGRKSWQTRRANMLRKTISPTIKAGD
jgi:hypothetical protein